MHRWVFELGVLTLTAVGLGCAAPVTPPVAIAPTTTPLAAPPPTAPPQPTSVLPSPTALTLAQGSPNRHNGLFDLLVLVDDQTPKPHEEIVRIIELGSALLFDKTGERFRLVDLVRGKVSEPDLRQIISTLAYSYVSNPPEGILVLGSTDKARATGGYAFLFRAPFAFQNEYRSARPEGGHDKIYIAVVDPTQKFDRCEPGELHLTTTSPTQCAPPPADHPYAKPEVFIASIIVHEFMHHFGVESNPNHDHYGTPACIRRTGLSAQEASNEYLAALNLGLCPDVFRLFRKSRP